MKKFSTLLCALALLLPTSLWAEDPDVSNYTLVKTMDFSSNTYDNDETYIELSEEASGIKAYETGNAKQQVLYAATAPADLVDYLQFQQAYSGGSSKGWWIRASKGGLWAYNGSRSAAVVGLKEGYLVCFTAANEAAISEIMTLVNADGDPDGNFTYQLSADGTSYWCTMTADGYVGFCGNKSVGYIASISIYAPSETSGIQQIEGNVVDDDAYYTLDGIKVKAPTKGIYIHNGKKVVVK